ncbi:primosomal protein N' family DNA-binding protein [Nonomuraea sp. NPDC003754]
MTDSDDALLPLEAVRPAESAKRDLGAPVAAAELPVARVVVDSPLPHLDRPFDYLVPETMDRDAVPGVRVRVRFAGKLVDGFLVERLAGSEHEGRLMALERVVSPEPVLTPEIAGLARAVADRYAGTMADVLRLAIPPRHARVESEPAAPAVRGRKADPAAPTAATSTGSASPGTDDLSSPAAAMTTGSATPAADDLGGPAGATMTGPATPADDDLGAKAAAPGGDLAAPARAMASEPLDAATATPGGPVDPVGTMANGPVTPAREAASDSAYPATASDSVDPATASDSAYPATASGPVIPVRGAASDSVDPACATASDSVDPASATASGPVDSATATATAGGPVMPVRGAAGGPAVAAKEPPADQGAGGDATRDDPTSGNHPDRPSGTGAGNGSAWDPYPMGASFLDALANGRSPRAVWSALPGGVGWTRPVAEAVRATLDGGRGAVVVVPDGKDVTLADQALSDVLGPGRHVALTADLGPAERYRRWLRVLRGQVRAVVGTRAAMFAPVEKPGLLVIWDDGDDLHAERLAPYPHAREVLALRAHRTGAGMLIGGYSRTAESTQLIAAGWARPIVAGRQAIRSVAPRVRPAGEDGELAKDQAARAARLPSLAWRALQQGLADGPVLVQVPRRGYLPSLACRTCRAPARCVHPPTRATITGEQLCHGPLALRGGHAAPYCRWCGRIAGDWRCPTCGDSRIRASVVGARRTAEELGRAFPSVPVKTSGRDGVLATVGPGRALVVATPGAEPVPEGGYAAAVLLDGWAMLGRADLRAAEEAVRRWMNAAALLRPRAELVVLADAAMPAVQALLRWDPVTHAERELAERRELGFPPAVRMATLTGTPAAVREMLGEVRLPPEAQVLGPVPVETRRAEGEQERAMIRVPRALGQQLATALKGAMGVRAARKAQEVVRVSVDPLDLI